MLGNSLATISGKLGCCGSRLEGGSGGGGGDGGGGEVL